MKSIFTLFFTFLSIGIFAQSLQLDSIIHIDVEYGEIDYRFDFKYQDDKVVQFIEDSDLILNISYDDQGNYSIIEAGNDYEGLIITFEYSDDQILQSFLLNYDDGTGINIDYEYEDDKIKNIIYSSIEGSDTSQYLRKEYSYAMNSVKKVNLINFGGQEQIQAYEEFFYDDQNRLIRFEESDDYEGVYEIDSFVYDMDQNFSKHYEITEYDGLVLKNDYSSDATVSFENISNPAGIFEVILTIFEYIDDDYASLYYPMIYGNKVNSQVQNDFGEYDIQWYYSLMVANKNTRVIATPLSVFPNPTTEYLKIESNQNMIDFAIYDINGAIVKIGTPESNMVSVSELANGNYTIVSNTKNNQYYFSQFSKF